MNIYTLLSIKQITNKDLLCSTENYIQYLKRKEKKRKNINEENLRSN